MENIRDIANWFLSKSPMTHKKVQKLCYYAQAWYCALYNGEPLFEDEIQAWVHGPVIASLHPDFTDYKWDDIPKRQFDDSKFSAKTIKILETVYNTYGNLTGDQLESLTHSEDPWIITRENLKPWEPSTKAIPCSVLRNYYGKKYEQAQND